MKNIKNNKAIKILLTVMFILAVLLAFFIWYRKDHPVFRDENGDRVVVDYTKDYEPLNEAYSISNKVTDEEIIEYLKRNNTLDNFEMLLETNKTFPFETLTDINGETINFKNEIILVEFVNTGCDYLTGNTEKLLTEIDEFDYQIVQVLTYADADNPKQTVSDWYSKFNLEVPQKDFVHFVVLDSNQMNKLQASLNLTQSEMFYVVRDVKVIGATFGSVSTKSTLDYYSYIFQTEDYSNFVNNDEVKSAINTLNKENNQTSNETQTIYIEPEYNNEELDQTFEVEIGKSYTIGLNLPVDISTMSLMSDDLNECIYSNGLGTINVQSVSFEKSTDDLLYEDNDANIYITFTLTKKNNTGHLQDVDGLFSMVFLKDSNGDLYRVVLNNAFKVKGAQE